MLLSIYARLKIIKQIQNESKINNIIKLNMKEKYDNQVKGHRLPPGQGSSIRIRNSEDRQHNGQKKKDKRTKHDLQNISQKTKE
jgi:hypothetical protein